jgi:cobalt/nickel transport system permease protein
MLKNWVGHHHGHHAGMVHRLPAGLKLAVAFAIVGGTLAAPGHARTWFVGVGVLLAVVAVASKLPFGFLIRRLLLLSPFVGGVILANALRPDFQGRWRLLAARSAVCLFTVILLSNTTPFRGILAALKRVHVPALLLTTLALMHRYLFVLVEESERMRRARASRTLGRSRRLRWRASGSVVGHLFLRASERAERIYDAMCARGWK